MTSSRRRSPLSPPPNDPNKLIQAILLHPKYNTIAADVDARRHHSFTDALKSQIATNIVQRDIQYRDFNYDIADFLENVYDTISATIEAHYQSNKPYQETHAFLSMYLMYELCRIIVILDNLPFNPKDPQLKNKKNLSNITYGYFIHDIQATVRDWADDYPLLASSRFTKRQNYIAVFMYALELYCMFRIQQTVLPEVSSSSKKIYLNRFTIEQTFQLIETLKIQILPKLNLHHTLNNPKTPHVERRMLAMLSQYLKDIHQNSLEMFVYPWYFITTRVVGYEKPMVSLSPSKYASLCKERFQNTVPEHSVFVERLIHDCSLLSTNQEPIKAHRELLRRQLKNEFGYYTPTESWDIDPNRSLNFHNIPREASLHICFLIWYEYKIRRKDISEFWSCYFDVRFVGEEGIYVGVQQDFLQTCLNQLAALNPPLFVPTEPKSDRFHINRHYRPPNDIFEYIHPVFLVHPGFTDSLIFKQLFLQFVGGLLCRCMLVGLELPFKLSFYTLGFLCNPTAKDDSQYTLYYLLDHPEKSAETLGLLKVKPEEFPYLVMNFNTPYPISQEDPTIDPRQQQSQSRQRQKTTTVGSPKNPDLTIENTETFINRTAYYVLSTVDANDPSVIPEEARAEYKKIRRDNIKLLKAFRKGFYIRPEGIAANETVAVNVLDKLLNDGGISAEKFRTWLQSSPPIIQYPEIDTVNMTPEQIDYLRNIYPLQWRAGTIFVNDILGNPSVKLPYDKIEGFNTLIQGKSAEEIATIKKEFYFKSFIPNLLYFWTSSRMIHPDKTYKIAFNINDPAHDPHALARLPMSHTCFYTLDIPTFYAVDTKEGIRDALLEKLVIAIYKNVGFGVAGGGRRAEGSRP